MEGQWACTELRELRITVDQTSDCTAKSLLCTNRTINEAGTVSVREETAHRGRTGLLLGSDAFQGLDGKFEEFQPQAESGLLDDDGSS